MLGVPIFMRGSASEHYITGCDCERPGATHLRPPQAPLVKGGGGDYLHHAQSGGGLKTKRTEQLGSYATWERRKIDRNKGEMGWTWGQVMGK